MMMRVGHYDPVRRAAAGLFHIEPAWGIWYLLIPSVINPR
jgi:hypothetical protein